MPNNPFVLRNRSMNGDSAPEQPEPRHFEFVPFDTLNRLLYIRTNGKSALSKRKKTDAS